VARKFTKRWRLSTIFLSRSCFCSPLVRSSIQAVWAFQRQRCRPPGAREKSFHFWVLIFRSLEDSEPEVPAEAVHQASGSRHKTGSGPHISYAAPWKLGARSLPRSTKDLAFSPVTGTVATILVPSPGLESMLNRPRIRRTRSCMLTSPSP